MINFFKGMIIGIAMAAPVGPLALLCIRRSLSKGPLEGGATALGVALVDGFYALVAALGLSAVSTFVLSKKEYLFIGGGLILILLGARALMHPPVLEEDTKELDQFKKMGFIKTLAQTMVLTLTNPMTLVTFIAAFSAVGFEEHQGGMQAILIATGVFTGSFLWFLALTGTVAYFRDKVTPFIYRTINSVSGVLLIVYGIVFLVDAAGELLYKAYSG